LRPVFVFVLKRFLPTWSHTSGPLPNLPNRYRPWRSTINDDSTMSGWS